MFNIVYQEPFGSATTPSDIDGAIATHRLDPPDLIMVLGIPDGVAWQEFGHGGHRRLGIVSTAHRSPLNWRWPCARGAADALVLPVSWLFAQERAQAPRS
jgi:hypothetical protein